MTKLRVPFTRSLSLTRNFTLTPDVVVVASSLSLALLTAFHAHQNSALSVLFFVFFLLLAFINQHTGTNTFFPLLFCLIVYVLLDFILRLCLWRLKKRGCQITCCKISKLVSITDRSLQLPLSLLLMSSNFVVTVTHLKVVETAAAAAGISPYFSSSKHTGSPHHGGPTVFLPSCGGHTRF